MIELRGVTYSVPGHNSSSRIILDNVSLRVADGSLTCIMGASGSGKTTMLRLMAGLIKPDSGDILIDGHNIARMSERALNELRREMGFVFQYGALFDSLTVAENVGFALEQAHWPREKIKSIVAELLQAVGLPGIEDKMPDELSGGMKKRVAMARSLATSPRLVFYDEPTSGLDPLMARTIDDLMVQLRDRSGATNVVVSHDVSSVLRIADDILLLHEGTILERGDAAHFRRSKRPFVQQFLGNR